MPLSRMIRKKNACSWLGLCKKVRNGVSGGKNMVMLNIASPVAKYSGFTDAKVSPLVFSQVLLEIILITHSSPPQHANRMNPTPTPQCVLSALIDKQEVSHHLDPTLGSSIIAPVKELMGYSLGLSETIGCAVQRRPLVGQIYPWAPRKLCCK